jgi:methionyl aminopeptidase
MDQDVLEKYRSAGRILSEVMDEARHRVKVGVLLIEIAEFVEGSIISKGAQPAFPCNISLDRAAAHYTPGPKDETALQENMVKLDIGVHVDGYIADAAITIDLSDHPDLTEASSAALDAALELVGPGANTVAIGAAIEQAITSYGYRPVANLTGHGLLRYDAHAEPAIPNKAIGKGIILKEGDVIAIEPFATDGMGRISEAPITEIYGFSAHRPVRAPEARELMKEIDESYKTLPFARRWLKRDRAEYALMQLLRAGIVHRYPVLWEIEGALVSQAEHTAIVTDDGCEVITRVR